MKKLLPVIVFALACSFSSIAQVSISEEGNIGAMADRYVQINKSAKEVSGWRVQLIATTDRQKVMEAKSLFLRTYPEMSADWDYKAPYYKLNVGAFRTKIEANHLKFKLAEHYPNAYITKDNRIKPSQLF